MIPKRIEDITEEDLQELIDNSVIETRTKEYKQNWSISPDSEKKEFLADISSFANARGGDIYYGIPESDGIPTSLEGIIIENVDQTKQQLDQIIRNGVEPRIPNLEIQEILLSNTRYIIIIRIPKSWIAPHRIKFKENHRFWTRSSNGKYRMSVEELRTQFDLSTTLIERIRNFRINSVSKIIAEETPIRLFEGAKILLQLIPIDSFEPAHNFEVSKLKDQFDHLTTISNYGNYDRYVLDGYIRFHISSSGNSNGYVQFYNNGIIEAVDNRLLNTHSEQKKIPAIGFERIIIESITNYLKAQEEVAVSTPIIVYLTLINVIGYDIGFAPGVVTAEDHRIIDKDILPLPEIMINNFEVNVGSTMKTSFDALWNACNFPYSPNYDEEGNWIEKGHFGN